jgi:putative membrane protein
MLPIDPFNRTVLAIFLVLWAVSCINLPYPEFFAMQHAPTIVGMAGLILAERKQWMDRLGFSLVVAFLILHLIGARYLYSNVPYDDWSQLLFGIRINDIMGFERNHYDRLVHFCFGLLFVYPLWQFFQDQLRLTGWWAGVLSICVVLAASDVYEIAEWATAMTFAPDWAEAYNGQQGDVWDPQRDMALAAIGSIVAAGFLGLRRRQ